MKILVTGSSGYLGNNFINQYKNSFHFEKFSLLNEKLVDINLKDVETILHCAALVHQKKEHTYKKYHEINVEYPVNLAKLAKKYGVRQFIFISTVAVYGDDKEKVDENLSCNPVTLYGKSKLEAEKKLLKLNDENFIVSIIRLPMIYGLNAPGNIKMLIKVINKIPILPFGSIKNKRTFISIQNLCVFINEVIKQEKKGLFLVSDDRSLSTSELINKIANNMNKKILLLKIPLFEKILQIIKPSLYNKLYNSLEVDNSQTKKKLNIKQLINIDEGIELMVKGKK